MICSRGISFLVQPAVKVQALLFAYYLLEIQQLGAQSTTPATGQSNRDDPNQTPSESVTPAIRSISHELYVAPENREGLPIATHR